LKPGSPRTADPGRCFSVGGPTAERAAGRSASSAC
jgi:hypothetical protein